MFVLNLLDDILESRTHSSVSGAHVCGIFLYAQASLALIIVKKEKI